MGQQLSKELQNKLVLVSVLVRCGWLAFVVFDLVYGYLVVPDPLRTEYKMLVKEMSREDSYIPGLHNEWVCYRVCRVSWRA
jgi:hypothetical protein